MHPLRNQKDYWAIFCLSCIWKYGFALLAYMASSRSIYSLDSSRSIYSQLEVQFPAQLVYFSAGILLLLYFDKLKLHFRSILASRLVCFFSTIGSREVSSTFYGYRELSSSSGFGVISETSRNMGISRMAYISFIGRYCRS